jgi:hypothetical protein
MEAAVPGVLVASNEEQLREDISSTGGSSTGCTEVCIGYITGVQRYSTASINSCE